MTVYQSYISADGFFIGLSDIVLSKNIEGTGRSFIFPLKGGAVETERVEFVGCVQKSILISKTILMQWAGSYLTAYGLAKYIKNNEKSFVEDPEKCLDSFFAEHNIYSIDFTILFVLNGKVSCIAFGCEAKISGPDRFFKSGSGNAYINLFELFKHDVTKRGAGKVYKDIETVFFTIANCIKSELIDENFYYYRFGGWYEVIFGDFDGFNKVPYVVCFWQVEGRQMKPIFAIGNQYYDSSMAIYKIPLSGEMSTKIFYVKDFLSLSADRVEASFQTTLCWGSQIHIILNKDGHIKRFFMKSNDPDFIITLENGFGYMKNGQNICGQMFSP